VVTRHYKASTPMLRTLSVGQREHYHKGERHEDMGS